MTGHYLSIVPDVVVAMTRVIFAKATIREYSRTVKTTKCVATVTGFRLICSKVKLLIRQTVTTSVIFTFNFVE